jgi:hypothetical protein
MPYTTQWFIEGRIIQSKINETLTPELQDSYAALIGNLLDESEMAQSHLMLDYANADFPIFHKRSWLKNPRLGWVVIYGVNNPLLRWGLAAVLQLEGMRYRIVDTLSDAVEHLREVDVTLRTAIPQS